jgi:hypothetical protein
MDSVVDKTKAQRPSLEERLEPKLKDAEYLLVLVLAGMLWTAGFVDLFTHSSQNNVIFGLYSIPYFFVLILYSFGFVFWGWLIFPANSIDRFKTGLRIIQKNNWLGLIVFSGFGALFASMFLVERWVTFPLLEASLAILVILAASVILWSKPDGIAVRTTWRQWTSWLVILFIVIEIVLQGLSMLRVLPVENVSGMFTPYGRVYQNQEGFTNHRTNRLGWYYPDFKLVGDSYRIIFTGDRFLQGIQVLPEQNLGVLVQDLISQEDTRLNSDAVEIITLGLPGYGPGLYLDRLLIPYTIQPVQPAEVVVFFHLADDFQTASEPGGEIPYYVLNDNGKAALHSEDLELRHDLQHIIIRGYEPINPVRIASTHLFLFNLMDGGLRELLNERQHVPVPVSNTSRVSAEAPFGIANFVYTDSPESLQAKKIAISQLEDFRQELKELGISMRLVTIPYFPQSFYEQYQGYDWDTQVGDYDLLAPDQALKAFANQFQIPFLSLGEYFLRSGKSVEEIQTFFYQNGTGRFTPAGHEAVALAVYDCFYRVEPGCQD